MNYRHHYHAGGAADLLKHLVLMILVRRLQAKPTPICYLDTHAGTGLYDLGHEMSQKTGEYTRGVARLWAIRDTLPRPLGDLMRIVASHNPDDTLRMYPGSPRVVRALLRPGDRMVACELHMKDILRLQDEFRGDPQVSAHHRDGYDALKAFLPPKERRGLVLIDPPFERADEFTTMLANLKVAHDRWPTGCYALWYPIKGPVARGKLHAALMHGTIRRVLSVELYTRPAREDDTLAGSGLILVNPPWRTDAVLRGALPVLAKYLAEDDGDDPQLRARVEWLVGE